MKSLIEWIEINGYRGNQNLKVFEKANSIFNLNLESDKELFDIAFSEKGKFCICGNENKFKRITEGYSKFCSKKCLYNWRSAIMKGDKNNFHKLSDTEKKSTRKKQSHSMKKLIREGKFTPEITNSWGNTRIQLLINNKIKKYRSSWDAAFQLLNPELEYEKIRIPYIDEKGEQRNYIVDFNSENTLYEIKPESSKNSIRNKLKETAAIEQCKENGYKFMYVSETYFENSLNKDILVGHPDTEKLLKNLKQFYENKVN